MLVTASALEANVESINMLRRAKTTNDLIRAGSRWAEANGFDHWVFGIGAPASPTFLGTFPPRWMQTANEGDALSDPLFADAIKARAPVTWDLKDQTGISSPLTVTRTRLLRESWEDGLRSGITIPVAPPSGSASCVLAVSNTYAVSPGIRFSQEPFAVIFATYFQQAVTRVLGGEIFDSQAPVLIPREVECLQWASQGKTSNDIGVITGISASGVNYHINNAARKLGAKGRTQAVRRAYKLKLLAF